MRRDNPLHADTLFHTYGPQVLGWCIRLGGPDVDPEDAAQQVFETALRRIDDFRGDCAPSTWLFGITRRVLANLRRRGVVRRWLRLDGGREEDDIEAASEAATDEELDRLRLRRAVVLALEALGREHREVLVLAEIEERPAAEVAEMLGIPIGTVYSRTHAARKAFARVWEVRAPAAPGADNVIPLRRPR